MQAFELDDFRGKNWASSDFDDKDVLVVAFLGTECPLVKLYSPRLSALASEYADRGVAIVGINANDVVSYPADSPEKMVEEVAMRGYVFPYLFDETQEVAKALEAACTPEFYLFDGDRRLVYRGQFDGSRPSNPIPVTGADLRSACDAVLSGGAPGADHEDTHAAGYRALDDLRRPIGAAMGGGDLDLVGHLELLEDLRGLGHHGQIGVASHEYRDPGCSVLAHS